MPSGTVMHSCKKCAAAFAIDSEETDFLSRVSPNLLSKLPLPIPSLCPQCRLQRRMAHRNQIYVTRGSSASNEALFSMYLGQPPFPLLSNADWWDEKGWRPENFGQTFDFARPFFDQWRELRDQVPRPATNVEAPLMENSSYCNNTGELKNCYFVFDANTCEDCLYTETATGCRDCIDCSYCIECELCYDSVGCIKSYAVQSSTHCEDCSDCAFLFNCRSCRNCFGCVNLRRREYCVFNHQLSAQEYQEYLAALDLSSWETRRQITDQLEELRQQHPLPHLFGSQIEDCSGNLITRARAVQDSYLVDNAERLKYCFAVGQSLSDCQDLTIWGQNAELVYEACVCGNGIF
ncbi:hypothetical protein OAO01_05780, partial [Oligoflexia bacterium]|nr:hypothetical protein [Oligoflexia bacterium]